MTNVNRGKIKQAAMAVSIWKFKNLKRMFTNQKYEKHVYIDIIWTASFWHNINGLEQRYLKKTDVAKYHAMLPKFVC